MSTPHQQADNPTERLLSALREHGYEPKRSGTGWTCRCQAHEDREPSLSIGTGDDGRALVNCVCGDAGRCSGRGCAPPCASASVSPYP